MTNRAVAITALLAALAVVACSGDDATQAGQGGGGSGGSTGGSGGRAGSGGTGGSGVADGSFTGWTPEVPASLDAELPGSARPADCPAEYDWVVTIRGWMAAPGGAALPGAIAQMCIHFWDAGPGYVCLPAVQADDDGVFTKDMPEGKRCIKDAAVRALVPASGRSTAYCPLTPATDGVLRMRDPILLPRVVPAADLPPLGDENAWRDVLLDDGLKLSVKPSLYFSNVGKYEDLGAKKVPVDAVALCGDRSGFQGLYAMYREGTVQDEGWPITLPNDAGLAAGTKVELLVLGGLECQLDGMATPEAKWVPFGEGTVSADGSTITSDEGSGLPCVTWLAYREKT
jgi:hypothetical protein